MEEKFERNTDIRPSAPSGENVECDKEIAAVIMAAIAAAANNSGDGFIVRSIRRRKYNKW